MNLEEQITRDEGVNKRGGRHIVYRDSLGILTIGIGRNVEGRGLSDDEALYLLHNDISDIRREFDRRIPWWNELDEARKNALINMGFMGVERLMEFKHMLGALQMRDWAAASEQALNSKWASQVHDRAIRIARTFMTGE